MPSSRRIGLVSFFVVVLCSLPGCNALNPLCGSARPEPSLTSIWPDTLIFSQLPPSFVMTATGKHFVSSSTMEFNGVTLTSTVVSSTQLTATVTASAIPAPGSFTVVVKTPAGNSGALGCSSGGTSSGQTLAVN
jgi:hypothetical protein